MIKFSIVTVCYNAGDVIENTIKSVKSQTYKNIEYIIIDGKSQDLTLEIINKYSDCISKSISEKDSGIYDAMNKGAQLASGDYLIFMNAGDTFVDEYVLSNVEREIHDYPDVVYGDTLIVYKDETLYYKAVFFSDKDIHLPFNHQSVFVKTQLAKEYPFDLKYKIAGDYYFFYTIFKKGYEFKYLPFPIAYFVDGGFSYSNEIRTYKEVKDIQKRNSGWTYNYNLIKLWIRLKIRSIIPNKLVMYYRKMKFAM